MHGVASQGDGTCLETRLWTGGASHSCAGWYGLLLFEKVSKGNFFSNFLKFFEIF